MKFVLDENMQKKGSLPNNVVNVHELYVKNGFGKFGIADKVLLRLCEEKKMTVVTKDRALIIKANQKHQNAVYATDGDKPKWIFLSKNLVIENRGKLKKIIDKEIKENPNERVIVIMSTTVTKPRGRINNEDDDVYEEDEIVCSESMLGKNVFVVGLNIVGKENALEIKRRIADARITRVY